MSNLFYPTDIKGLTWKQSRTVGFRTLIGRGDSYREFRTAIPLYAPIYIWKQNYSFVKQGMIGADGKAGANELMAFVEAMRVGFDDFLYRDPDFNSIPSSAPFTFAIADGVTAIYQLSKPVGNGGYDEAIFDYPAPSSFVYTPPIFPGDTNVTIYHNGTAQSWNGIPNLGLKALFGGQIMYGNGLPGNSEVPTAGTVLSWSGNYYYRARFKSAPVFVEFMKNYWSTDVIFESVQIWESST